MSPHICSVYSIFLTALVIRSLWVALKKKLKVAFVLLKVLNCKQETLKMANLSKRKIIRICYELRINGRLRIRLQSPRWPAKRLNKNKRWDPEVRQPANHSSLAASITSSAITVQTCGFQPLLPILVSNSWQKEHQSAQNKSMCYSLILLAWGNKDLMSFASLRKGINLEFPTTKTPHRSFLNRKWKHYEEE